MRNNRKVVTIDFDDCIVDSTSAILQLHNSITGENIKEILRWDGSDAFPKYPKGYIEGLFSDKRMFDYLEFNDGAIEFISWLRTRGYVTELCTIGALENISNKIEFIKDTGLNLLFDDFHFIFQNSKDLKVGKEFVDSWLMIDDHSKNLTNKAKYNVLYVNKTEKEWNKDWNGFKVYDFDKLKEFIIAAEMCTL